MIEDSRETIVKFLESLPLEEDVQLQPISVAPYFNDDIERSIEEFNPGLIMLDLRLIRDEDSGFRVLRKLKESPSLKDIPVVVCSKYIGKATNDKNKLQAVNYGAVAALPKIPFPSANEFLKHYQERGAIDAPSGAGSSKDARIGVEEHRR